MSWEHFSRANTEAVSREHFSRARTQTQKKTRLHAMHVFFIPMPHAGRSRVSILSTTRHRKESSGVRHGCLKNRFGNCCARHPGGVAFSTTNAIAPRPLGHLPRRPHPFPAPPVVPLRPRARQIAPARSDEGQRPLLIPAPPCTEHPRSCERFGSMLGMHYPAQSFSPAR